MNQIATRFGLLLGTSFLLLSSVGCVQQQQHKKAIEAAEHYKKLYDSLKGYQNEIESRNRDLESQLAKAQVEGAEGLAVYGEASALREEYQRRVQALESSFRGTEGWKAGDIEIFRGPESEVYRIKDAILFDSGSANIKSSGKKVIQQIASEIQAAGKRIRVEGHTDSDPVVRSIDKFPYGNLQLSTARANEVAHALITDGKIEAARVSVAGYGEFRPIVSNDSSENKRKNRRVEIVVLDGNASSKK